MHTRRDFLMRIARYGGAAVMGSLFAMDLMGRDDTDGRLRLEGRAPGRRRKVLILGAGAAGLATAYELGRLGYDCVVLEARRRTGGRSWTVRGGAEETEVGGGGHQVCRFAEGHFMNAGPMRLANHQATALAYCSDLGVPLVPFTNINEAAWVYRDGYPRMRRREVRADWRGYTSELLAKVIHEGRLDVPLTPEDRERFIEYLRAEGRLDATLTYPRGGSMPDDPEEDAADPRGYLSEPGVGTDAMAPTVPLDLETLVKAGFGANVPFATEYNQQPTMLTPAGGMDRLVGALAAHAAAKFLTGAEVREIRRTSSGGVRVGYADLGRGGALREETGDFCVCALPPHLLRKIPSDFSPAAAAALGLSGTVSAGKMGIQFKRRFWEQDDGIYGGISTTNLPITQIVYPFDRFAERGPGVVLGYYHYGNAKVEFDDHEPAERQRRALAQGAKIHPQYPAEFDSAFSVAWCRIPYNEGSWARWETPADYARMQQVLGVPDGPFLFAGDWLSHMNAWQAGAFVSAHRTCSQLHALAHSA